MGNLLGRNQDSENCETHRTNCQSACVNRCPREPDLNRRRSRGANLSPACGPGQAREKTCYENRTKQSPSPRFLPGELPAFFHLIDSDYGHFPGRAATTVPPVHVGWTGTLSQKSRKEIPETNSVGGLHCRREGL